MAARLSPSPSKRTLGGERVPLEGEEGGAGAGPAGWGGVGGKPEPDEEQPLLNGAGRGGAASLRNGLPPPGYSQELGERVGPAGATVAQTTLNVFNVYVGIGVVSLAGAFNQGGYLSVVGLVLAGTLFCFSAYCMVKGFDALPAGVPATYPELGKHVAGETGRWFAVVVSMLEFSGAAFATIIVVWKQIQVLVEECGYSRAAPSSRHLAELVGTALILPSILLDNFVLLSYLGGLSLVCCFLLVAAVLFTLVLDPHRAHACPVNFDGPCPPDHDLGTWGIASATGIFAMALSGHAALPSIRASMKEPEKFKLALPMSFGAMVLTYTMIGLVGYVYFGKAATALITADIANFSVLAGQPLFGRHFTVDMLLNLLVALNAYATVAPVIMVTLDMLNEASPTVARYAGKSAVRRTSRVVLFAFFALVSHLAYNKLLTVESLTGGVLSMTSSLLLPVLFFYWIYRKGLSRWKRTGLAAILVFGLCMAVLITTESILNLVD